MTSKNFNGSVEILAGAMRKVFDECMTGTREAMKEDLEEVRVDLSERMDTTNKNMQAEFAAQEKQIAGVKSDVKALGKRA